MNKGKSMHHWGLLSLFALVVFLSVLLNAVISAVTIYILIKSGILILTDVTVMDAGRLLVFYIAISVPIGFVVALMASKVPLKPIRTLINSMDRLASGDFSTRANVGSVMQMYPPYIGVTESFNKMAEQLENTELLRMDFINNISHEFKTPIVSIAGFAKLLKRGNLTEEQTQEYLSIIEEESVRLSSLATNVLNLTKVENQTILTDTSVYNLSEQIRSCMLLLERKWENRDLDWQLAFEEHEICGNEDLLKQVWINLLDNAIKFTPDGNLIAVQIREKGDRICVVVRNTGSEIPAQHQKKIFNKFYQADESHSTQGNGIGLAIVKRIAQLHGGTVWVESENRETCFTVEIPKGIP